jgi:ribosome-binding protein aMBF1 (putative translation factor)
MLLNDIGKSPDSTFRKINQHLETNYGFKIAEDVSDKDLVAIMEQIEDEVSDLKLKGDVAKTSSEISKRLLVLEGLQALKEYSMMSFQSPKLNTVVSNLADYVVDAFEISGMSQADFDKALNIAMDEYRSSRYRFPDELITQKVRQEAMSRIQANNLDDSSVMEDSITDEEDNADQDAAFKGADIEEGSGDLGNRHVFHGQTGKRSSALGGVAGVVPDTQQAKHAMNVLDNPGLSLQDRPDEQVPMMRNSQGRMVSDPFAAQAAARRKGIMYKEGKEMKEHKSLVKNLRRLLETEVTQAEVMMAAKEFAKELQEMIEKIGRLQNEDLPPVTDQMRNTYGMSSASAFQTQIYGALQSVMDALYTAKGQVDDAVSNMAETGQFSASNDMEADPAMGDMDGMDDTMPMDADAGMDPDLDNIEGDLDAEDDFGAADEEEPLGRSMKTESLERKVMEMKKLVEKARKLREARG